MEAVILSKIYLACHEEEYQRFFFSQIEAVIFSMIYLACREEGYPRTMKEMCAVGTVTKKDLGKVFKQVLECVMMLLNV